MDEPYRTLYFYLVGRRNWPRKLWRHNVKWTGDAFYIGSDKEHITIMEKVSGFHHSFDSGGRHIRRDQHVDADSLESIIEHIKYNHRVYKEPKILAALEFMKADI